MAIITNSPKPKEDPIKAKVRALRGKLPVFCEKILKVQTMEGQIVPFVLNGPQLILHKIVEMIRAEGRPVRIIALKARRMGFSTYFSARFYQKTSYFPNQYAAQITHEPEATDTLFKMIKRFYNLSPERLRPETVYNNTRLLEFNKPDGRGLNSAFRVATAAKDDYGSGQLIHFCHFSEVSKWPADTMQSLLTSILQCVPDIQSSEVVFESTAKGIGGEFYDRFWGARYRVWISKLDAKGKPVIETVVNEDAPAENQYTSIFLPWFVFERYQSEPPKDFKLIEDRQDRSLCEVTIQKKYGLSMAQMYWRRTTLVNKCNNDINMLNQEYPACPSDAFIGTGSAVFDVVKLAKIKDTMPQPAARYDALTGLGQWVSKPDGKLRVWKEPIRGRAYIIGADVAEGLSKGDFSCADVIDHVTGEQVAQWHGHVDADQFGMLIAMLAKRYNEAFVAVERNNHGLTTLTVLNNMDYPNLYAERVPDPPGKPRTRYGWLTGRATKPLIIDNLVMELREDQHGINCRETIEEMMTYKRDDAGRTDAEEGRHDDRVMSLAIAKHVRQTTPVPKPKKVPDHYKIRSKRRGGRVRSAAWT